MKKQQIIIFDDLGPESTAMSQALYSRAPQSVLVHLEKVRNEGPEKFMSSYYVEYGHKSIGDCGTTTICIENVSMLVAKAIQDWPLYNGQEASTRYLDMAQQEILSPVALGESIQQNWMNFYSKALEKLVPYISDRFPKEDGQSDVAYKKAVKAKAFDIARGFLPAGATTYLSWHTNLRQAHDHLLWLEKHPLQEVINTAKAIRVALQEKYPNSFSHKEYPAQQEYFGIVGFNSAYYHNPECSHFVEQSFLDMESLRAWRGAMESRPEKSELPHQMRECGNVRFEFPLDFGSFRDIQRHRSGVCTLPLLTADLGFHPWYLEQLPIDLRQEALELIETQKLAIERLDINAYQAQYYYAMGFQVSCKFTLPLPAAVYVAELRSTQHVHPTLRVIAQKMGKTLSELIPRMKLYVDYSEDIWSIKRGNQDIVKK